MNFGSKSESDNVIKDRHEEEAMKQINQIRSNKDNFSDKIMQELQDGVD